MMNFTNCYCRFVMSLEQINDAARNCPKEFVDEIERYYHKEVDNVCDMILSAKHKKKIVMLTGPSGSGKTTTAKKVKQSLEKMGIHADYVSLDNFYIGKNNIPLNEQGVRDLESPNALRQDEIRRCVSDILNKGNCDIPIYDFGLGAPKPENVHIEIGKDDIIIIEGIHALNPSLIPTGIDEENIFKIYVSVKHGIKDYNNVLVSHQDIRLLRRLVRDFRDRSTGPQETISMWQNVINGQMINIQPFKRSSDATINSLHLFELCVLRNDAIKLLSMVNKDEPQYEESKRLLSEVEKFYPIDEALVPDDSLIREFLGGGIY